MNRRSFLTQSGIAAGAAALPVLSSKSIAAGIASPTATVQSSRGVRGRAPNIQATLTPYTGPLTLKLALHLLRRTGFGPRYSEASAITNGNISQIVDAMLADQAAPAGPTTWDPTAQPDYTQAGQTANNTNTALFRNWWMDLMYNSNNPLREKMVLFWTNHFVSEAAKVKIPQYLYWQNVLFRQFAFGNFKDFVKAVTIDNAMVWYLDSYTNTKGRPNENYARELMELFTIGPFDTANLSDIHASPNPNYTETDIQQAARALTGWTMHTTPPLSASATADFHSDKFDTGTDMQFLLNGPSNFHYGDIVDIIFNSGPIHQPDDPTGKNKVALFICTKLYGNFVYDDPGDATIMTPAQYKQYCNPLNPIVQGMADTFVANSFSIRSVLRQLLTSEHFFDQNTVGAQLKSPIEFMLSSTRQIELGVPANFSNYLVSQVGGLSGSGLNQLNQPPNVKGFPGYHTWISTASLPSRNQLSDLFVSGGKGTVDTIALAKLVSGNDPATYNSASKVVQAFADFLFPLPISASQISTLKDALLNGAAEVDWSTTYPNADKMIQQLLSVMLRFAEFQLA